MAYTRQACEHVALLVDQRLDDIAQRFAELERARAKLLSPRDRLASLDPADCRDDICVAFRLAGPGGRD